jgi:hypothetical protein
VSTKDMVSAAFLKEFAGIEIAFFDRTIIGVAFILWLTKGLHGVDDLIAGMIAVAGPIMRGVLKWEDIHENLEWGTALLFNKRTKR